MSCLLPRAIYVDVNDRREWLVGMDDDKSWKTRRLRLGVDID